MDTYRFERRVRYDTRDTLHIPLDIEGRANPSRPAITIPGPVVPGRQSWSPELASWPHPRTKR